MSDILYYCTLGYMCDIVVIINYLRHTVLYESEKNLDVYKIRTRF